MLGGAWHIPDDAARPHGMDVVHALGGGDGWAWRTWTAAGPAAWCGPGWGLTGAAHDLADQRPQPSGRAPGAEGPGRQPLSWSLPGTRAVISLSASHCW